MIDQKGTMMERSLMKVSLAVGLVMGAATAAAADFPACPVRRGSADAVLVGTLCLDIARGVAVRRPVPGWASFSNDGMCLAGASTTRNGPAALVRRGAFASLDGPRAGPLAVRATFQPSHSDSFFGLRCAR
jgi:hypothetical protein